MFKWAAKEGRIPDDPTLGVTREKVRTTGYKTWSEENIARFEARHAIGTKARLAFALLLYTSQRRSDVVKIGRQHIYGEVLTIDQGKTEGGPPLSDSKRADLAASFQQAVVDVLVAKARQALSRTGLTRLAVGGGVAANRHLRAALEKMMREQAGELFIPPLELCTDNAAMAAVAAEKWRAKERAGLDLDAVPTLLS